MRDYLDFEKPIADLEERLNKLKTHSAKDTRTLDEVRQLEKKLKKVKMDIYSNITPLQKVKIARHKSRPTAMYYINEIFTGFNELHGDRLFMDDPAIVAGIGQIGGEIPAVVIAHQKGSGVRDRTFRNFGMPNPEGYRKAIRIMKLAEQFDKPIVTFIDTPGAYPGMGAEERGQAEAIASSIMKMFAIKVPIICVIIGEGGSGGALAIGVGDHIAILEHSIYSVISPEGCAAILWNDSSKADDAAKSLKITANDLLELNVVDEVIPEPDGGAHRNPEEMAKRLQKSIIQAISALGTVPKHELLEKRHEKFRRIGAFQS